MTVRSTASRQALAEAPPTRPPDRRTDTFRPDVEGLRGLAVLLVVLFHGWPGGLTGGFIGVDVFFVISGYLITGLLVRERSRSGTIGLGAFYARRARRLLPAAMVAVVVTLLASVALVAPLDRAGVAADARAAALSFANIRFALAAGDYFATVSTPSPFLHFWSLAVEEQFYLVWPALILLVARGGNVPRRVGIALAAVCVVSFAASLVLTDIAGNWAFYSLPTRAWQLGMGGLLAVGGARLTSRLPRATAAAGWLGLVAIVAASLALDTTTAYPGAAALVPTVATAAVLASGPGRFAPGRLLALAPMRFLGKISYSLYLWHWPILVLVPLALGSAPDPVTSGLLVAVSVAVATVSWSAIETPFRSGLAFLGPRPRRTVSLALAATMAVAILATGVSAGPGFVDTVAANDAEATTAKAVVPDEVWVDVSPPPEIALGAEDGAEDGGEATGMEDSHAQPVVVAPAPVPASQPPGTAPATPLDAPVPLAADITPSLDQARADEDRLRHDGCLAYELVTVPQDCVYGDAASKTVLALVGDSHAAQWFPALDRLARHEGWRLVVFTKVSCPFLDMPVINTGLKREYRECEAWNEAVVEHLRTLRPDLTLVASSRLATHPLHPSDDTVAARGAAMARMVRRLPGRTAIIVDTPYAGRDIPACLSAHPDDIRRCAIARATAFTGGLGKVERAAAEATDSVLVDLTGSFCPVKGPCDAVVDNHIVYRDQGHITATFARSQAPLFAAILKPVLAGP